MRHPAPIIHTRACVACGRVCDARLASCWRCWDALHPDDPRDGLWRQATTTQEFPAMPKPGDTTTIGLDLYRYEPDAVSANPSGWVKVERDDPLRQAVPRPILDRAFWLVWTPSGKNPTMKHRTHDDAQGEAERLAAANPGVAFYVMRFTGGARSVAVVAPIAPGPGHGAKHTEDGNPVGPVG